jgi:large subunit ribosomal protein L24
MQRVKSGDQVLVIAGKDKGAVGEVLRVHPKENKVVVERVNITKKHQRAQQAGRRQIQPGIVEYEGTIDLSNVMVICPSCGEASRIGFRMTDDGKVRYCKKCDEDLD